MPRIDKVRLDNYYNRYTSPTPPVRRAGNVEPPLPFDPDEKGVVYEPSGATGTRRPEQVKEEERTARAEETRAATATLSAGAAKEESIAEETAAQQESLTDWLRSLGARLLTFLRGVWSNIWNGPEGAPTATTDTADTTAELSAGEEAAEAEASAEDMAADAAGGASLPGTEALSPVQSSEFLQQIIADHDLDRLVRYVTADGEKKPARSTDLLTIYNRYGRVNTIDPSDRKKILEGNFNDIKL